MEDNLKVVNMMVSGKIPLTSKMKFEEIDKLIEKGNLKWRMGDDEKRPILSFNIEKEGLNSHGENRIAHISMWPTGNISITGITKEEEADEIYNEVLKEIKKICPRVMKNV